MGIVAPEHGQWTKLPSGEWAVMYYGQAEEGDEITVQRRDGSIKEVEVLEVLEDHDVAVLVSVEDTGLEWTAEEWAEEQGYDHSPQVVQPDTPPSGGGCLGVLWLLFLVGVVAALIL